MSFSSNHGRKGTSECMKFREGQEKHKSIQSTKGTLSGRKKLKNVYNPNAREEKRERQNSHVLAIANYSILLTIKSASCIAQYCMYYIGNSFSCAFPANLIEEQSGVGKQQQWNTTTHSYTKSSPNGSYRRLNKITQYCIEMQSSSLSDWWCELAIFFWLKFFRFFIP